MKKAEKRVVALVVETVVVDEASIWGGQNALSEPNPLLP
jgi:hypothetical protein